MPVGLVPVGDAASALGIDLHVLGAAHRTAVADSGRLDAFEDRIKFVLIDPEAEVLNGKGSVVINEIESQSVIDVYGRERSGTRVRPVHTKQLREALGRNALISCGDDDVIQFYSHAWTSMIFGAGKLAAYERRLTVEFSGCRVPSARTKGLALRERATQRTTGLAASRPMQ